MNKSSKTLRMLILLNAALVVTLVFVQWRPALAFAQNGDITERYIAVAGEYQNNRDAIFVLDTKFRALHAFEYELGRRKFRYTAMRDLEADFRNN